LKASPRAIVKIKTQIMKRRAKRRINEALAVNPSTLRSRERRDRLKRYKRDPLVCIRYLWLPYSVIDLITLELKAARPQDRDRTIRDEKWDEGLAQAIRDIVETAVKAKHTA
jgi:hypothetical protein